MQPRTPLILPLPQMLGLSIWKSGTLGITGQSRTRGDRTFDERLVFSFPQWRWGQGRNAPRNISSVCETLSTPCGHPLLGKSPQRAVAAVCSPNSHA